MSVFKDQPFYHGTIQKFIAAFGSTFEGISIVDYDEECNKEKVIRTPIAYGPKNKWLARLLQQPDLTTPRVKVTLPRLSFEITDVRYDPTRKVGTIGSHVPGMVNGHPIKLFNPVPYNLMIQMYSYTKDQGDALQIMEQILPYFAPTLEIKMEQLPQLNMIKTIPIQLDSIAIDDSYGDNNVQTQRTVIQTFTFTAKLDFFGPIFTNSKEIKKAIIDYSVYSKGIIDSTYTAEVEPFSANKDEDWNLKETWEVK